MNIPVEKILEDINSLRRMLRESGATLPSLERDLLLQRIRELYETVLNTGAGGSGHSSHQKITAEISSVNIPEGEKISHPVKQEHDAEDIPLHERIAFHHEDLSVAGVMQHRKIATLKQAIGVNEKFLFIRELFGNEPEAYQYCIEKIDAATSLVEATSILDAEYAPRYSWNKEGNAYFHFISLVERRFV